MGRARHYDPLFVALNGRLVGTLERASTGAMSFAYDTGWLAYERAIPVSLSLPLRKRRYIGEPVIAYFDNLLPDNDDIRRKVAERVGAGGTDAYSLLSQIGRDCVGALQFVSDPEEIVPPELPQSLPLRENEVADIMRNLATAPLGMDKRDFRISIAGAQEKTALLWDNGWCLPVGMTPTTHIIKPQIGKLPNGLDMSASVENEHFCLTLCRELGLEAAATEIHDFEDVRVLAVERFDRLKTRDNRLLRIPQEDFCQALSVPPSQKYNANNGPGILECLALLEGSDYADQDRRAFMKAQIVFWLMGATDGHAKNFSVFLTPGGRYRMTPLYDVLSAQPDYDAHRMRRREYKLAMAVGDSRNYPIYRIHPRHFTQNAKAAGMPAGEVEGIFAELAKALDGAIERTVAAMPEGFPMAMADSIASAMRERLAERDTGQGEQGG